MGEFSPTPPPPLYFLSPLLFFSYHLNHLSNWKEEACKIKVNLNAYFYIYTGNSYIYKLNDSSGCSLPVCF